MGGAYVILNFELTLNDLAGESKRCQGRIPKWEAIISSWDYFDTTDSMSLVFSVEVG